MCKPLRTVLFIFLAALLALSAAQTDTARDAAPLELSPVTLDGTTLAPGDPLPVDPELRVGKLDNGLTYYIRQNTEPRNRAELALVVNAGSVLEDEDQRGLAHLLEHMLFNGTENFAGPEIVNYLESIGMTFGADVNAYTSFDETVYTLTVPLDDEETVRTAFAILSDWAARATLDPAEIDAERPVVIEEERLRDQNVNGRLLEQILPVQFGDSRYAERLPIGSMDVIRNAPPETLRRFYETWYRPDLMALIAVGDFAPAVFEGYIEDAFAGLQNPADPEPRVTYDVPPHEDTRYLITSDPEFPYTFVELDLARASESTQTVQDYGQDLASSLFTTLLNQRLDERSRAADAPFLGASVGTSGLTRDTENVTLGVQTDDGAALDGLAALVEEVERARRFGFTETELARAKDDLLSFLEQRFQQQDDIDSSALVSFLTSTFLENSVYTTNETDYKLAEELLPQITLDDVNALAETLLREDNRVVLVIAPEKAGLELPTQAEVAGVIAEAQTRELSAYEDTVTDADLVETPPAPAAVTDETYLGNVDATVLTLENGVRVVVKTTDFTRGEVLMSGVSYGGSSLVGDADVPEASIITSVVGDSGVGSFSKNELNRLLTGKNVSLSVSIGELTEGFSGSAEKSDLTTLFELVYLYATQPREDTVAFARTQDQLRAALRNRDTQPQAVFRDAVAEALYGDAPRRQPLTLDEVDTLDYARAFDIYQERFADMGDFVFTFVGDVTVDEVRDLAQRYLGNLPSAQGEETYADVAPDLPDGVVAKAVYKGKEQQSIVHVRFFGPMNPSRQERLKLLLLENALSIVVREELRETLGGTYSPNVFSNVSKRPKATYAVGVEFSADPARVDELVQATFKTLTAFRVNGPDADTFAKAQEQAKRNYETNFEQNGFWRYVLEYYLALNPDEDVSSLLDYENEIDALTPQDLRDAAQTYLHTDRYAGVVLYPESYALVQP